MAYLQALDTPVGYPDRLRELATMQDYHQLKVWQRAMNYAVDLYKFTAQLPSEERYNLTVQLRRAVVSVSLNIAEGSSSGTTAEFIHFLGYGSLKEVITGLELCQRLYPSLPVESLAALIDEGNQISRMTHSLIQKLSASGGDRHNKSAEAERPRW
jgi:four helix bundle protein